MGLLGPDFIAELAPIHEPTTVNRQPTTVTMSRYIKKFGRIGYALGPSEERGFAMWGGYDIVGVDDDLEPFGLIKVEGWPPEELARYDVATFVRVEPDDEETYRKLGIERKR